MDYYTQSAKKKQRESVEKLPLTTFRVLEVLWRLERKYECNPYPSIAKLAELSGLEQGAVCHHLAQLEEQGYLVRQKRPGTSTVYILLDKCRQIDYPLKSFKVLKPFKLKQEKKGAAASGDPMDFIRRVLIDKNRFNKKMLQEFYRRIGNLYWYSIVLLEKAWRKCQKRLKRVQFIPSYFAMLVINEWIKERHATRRRPQPFQPKERMKSFSQKQMDKLLLLAQILDHSPPKYCPGPDWHPGMG